MNLDDIIVIAINKVIAGKKVCLVVNKLSDLRAETKVVLTHYNVSVVGAIDKYKSRPDCFRMTAMEYQEIYCYNVDISCFCAKYMHSRLRSTKPDEATVMHFYYGNGQTALPGLTVVE